MNFDAEIKQERKYSRYGIILFSTLILFQLIAYVYDLFSGNKTVFPYVSIVTNLAIIFCFRYIYSLVYLFKKLNELEDREVRRVVHERLKKNSSQS